MPPFPCVPLAKFRTREVARILRAPVIATSRGKKLGVCLPLGKVFRMPDGTKVIFSLSEGLRPVVSFKIIET